MDDYLALFGPGLAGYAWNETLQALLGGSNNTALFIHGFIYVIRLERPVHSFTYGKSIYECRKKEGKNTVPEKVI